MEQKDGPDKQVLKKDEKNKLFRLLGICFGSGSSGDGVFKWKYEQYPWPVIENTVAIRRNGEIAGAISLWPMGITIGGDHILKIMVAGGAATHPEFRKKGLWWEYMKGAAQLTKERGSSLLFGYVTSTTPTYKARKARGIKELFTQNYHVKILNYQRFFESALQGREFQNLMKVSEFAQKIRRLDERIQIVPNDGEPFILILKRGDPSVEKGIEEDPTIIIKGEISKLIYARGIASILKLILTGKIKLKISLSKIRTAYGILKILRRAL